MIADAVITPDVVEAGFIGLSLLIFFAAAAFVVFVTGRGRS